MVIAKHDGVEIGTNIGGDCGASGMGEFDATGKVRALHVAAGGVLHTGLNEVAGVLDGFFSRRVPWPAWNKAQKVLDEFVDLTVQCVDGKARNSAARAIGLDRLEPLLDDSRAWTGWTIR
jgi:hypothetical protein